MHEEKTPLQPVSSSVPNRSAVPTGSSHAAAAAAPALSPPQSAGQNQPQPQDGSKPHRPKNDGLFSALKDVLPVLAVYSYFAGWIYAYSFYKAFRVSVSSLDIPFQYFFMYSFSALVTWKGALAILVAMSCVALLRKHRFVMLAVACLLFLVLFGIAFVQGTTDAKLQRHSKSNDRIVLSFTEDAMKSVPSDLAANNQQERLRLLAETKDRVLVFYQPPPIAAGEIPAALVYDIAKSDVVAVKRQVTDKQTESLPETLWRIIHEQPAK